MYAPAVRMLEHIKIMADHLKKIQQNTSVKGIYHSKTHVMKKNDLELLWSRDFCHHMRVNTQSGKARVFSHVAYIYSPNTEDIYVVNCIIKYKRFATTILLDNSTRRYISKTMMTSSNGNIFRVTGHLCGEFTGPRWIPRTKASDAELWCFLWSASK